MSKKNKLKVGDSAPSFSIDDIYGETISLSKSADEKTLLCFFRYAGCPWCNLAIYRLTQMAPRLEKHGVRIICFVQSSKENIMKNIVERHIPKPPFKLIADPEKKVYDQYGVEDNVLKYIPSLIKIPDWIHSSAKLHFKQGKVDGSLTLVPAQFLISSDGYIIKAHYGANYADELSFKEIHEALLFGDKTELLQSKVAPRSQKGEM